MNSIVAIKNNTGVPQSVVFKGRQIVLDAHGQGNFDSEVADHFIKNRSPLVSMVEEEPDIYEGATEMVWLANFTGNEDLPETVNVKQWVGGKWARADVPNLLREPIVIERWCDGGMQEYIAKDGAPESFNLAKIRFRLPPYTRRLFPKDLATWSLIRDATTEFRGGTVKSRAPTSFEPNESWSLDDSRGYLRLIDPSANVGPSETDVRSKAAKDPEAIKAGESGLQAYVDDAKRTLLRRLFFRVANPQYHLPLREEFNEFMRGETPVELSDADAVMDMLTGSAEETNPTKRKRGRPPGSKNKPKEVSATP
tara:strand:- start:2370 stop:3299 length:930 start_codon:yes stop_codon:yes gene_type:complete